MSAKHQRRLSLSKSVRIKRQVASLMMEAVEPRLHLSVTPTFGSPTTYSNTQDNFSQMTITADLAGNGKPDLIEADQGGKGISIYAGNGDGTFNSTPTFIDASSLGDVNSVVAGDFNGDGKIDLAVDILAPGFNYDIVLYTNNGNGTFTPTVLASGSTSTESAQTIVAGNFGGHGDIDIAATTENQVLTFLNDGHGNFTAGPTITGPGTSINTIAITHPTASGPEQLIVGANDNQLDVYQTDGAGGLTETSVVSLSGSPASIAPIDTTGAGLGDDLAVTTYSNQLAIILATSTHDGTYQTPTYTSLPSTPWQVATADLNGDGKADLVIAETTRVEIFLGNGDGTFSGPTDITTTGNGNFGVTVAPLKTGFPTPDLVITTRTTQSEVQVLLNQTVETTPQYRLSNPVTGDHIYTIDANENTVLSANGWTSEGSPYNLYNAPYTVSGVTAVPLYRLYDPTTQQHLWTIDVNEKNVLTSNGWNYEKIDGYIMPTQVAGTTALFRLDLPGSANNLHLWTNDSNEDSVLISEGWVQEEIVGYVA